MSKPRKRSKTPPAKRAARATPAVAAPAAAQVLTQRCRDAERTFHAGDAAGALAMCATLLGEQPHNAEVLHLCGILHAQAGQLPRALELLGRAMELAPQQAGWRADHASALTQAGRLEQAVAGYDAALQMDATLPDAWFNRGVALHMLGKPEAAVESYDRALAAQPGSAHAWANRGVALQALGRHAQALESFDRTLALAPDSADAWSNRGIALAGLGDPAQAMQAFERAIACAPDFAEAHYNLGHALKALGRHDEALASLDRALALGRASPELLYERADTLYQLGRFEECARGYTQLAQVQPDNPRTLCMRAMAWGRLGRHADALHDLDRALALQPAYADAWCNRGVALEKLGRHAEALESCERAIALQPGLAEAWSNRGVTLQSFDRLHEAIASYDRAIRIKPDFLPAHTDRASVFNNLLLPREAVAGYERALALQPDAHAVTWNLALTLLRNGEFARGWELYESRWQVAELQQDKRDLPLPVWSGVEPLQGKSILVHTEQGLGDVLQFCRYLPLLAARGARVVLGVMPTLIPLLGSLEGVDELAGPGTEVAGIDYQCALLSLPRAFGTRLETIPAPRAYLQADPQRVAHWRERLGRQRAPRVGLAWSGNPRHFNDRHRSIALASLAEQLPGGIEYVSLQQSVREPDQAALATLCGPRHFGAALADMADTAALCELVDIVVSVDTAVAHLAAAMGKPVWILLPYSPDWRWLLGRRDSPWYPTVTLYRQAAYADWSLTLSGLGSDLARHFRERGAQIP